MSRVIWGAVRRQWASDAAKAVAQNAYPRPMPEPPKTVDAVTKAEAEALHPQKMSMERDIAAKSLPFDEVPGPVVLRQIASFWKVIPVMGTEVTASTLQYMLSAGSQLAWGRNLRLFRWLFDEYGPVVRLHGPFGGDVVILNRPEHVNAIFQNEGPYPVRSCLDCVEKYRLKYRRYKLAGPFIMSGPEWESLRKSIEQPLQEATVHHFDKIESACDDFIARVSRIRNRQEEVGPDFKTEIYKWALECICSVTLKRKVGFLELQGLSSASEPARMLESLIDATDAIRRCENGLHLWKFVETPAWKTLVRCCDTIDGIVNKYIQRSQEHLRSMKTTAPTPTKLSLMESLLLKEGVMPEDILTVILDMLLIGVNTTVHTVAFLLYHLARNPRAQHKLYDEIKSVSESLDKDKLMGMKYLQACIKESLRLKPPMPVLSRVLTKDIVIHNYRIPSGTYVLIATHLSSLKEEHFEDATKFNPDRWLTPHVNVIENYASIPFGYGPRACVAKDLAETQIGTLLFKVLDKFRVEYHYGDINSNNRLLAAPDRPLKFRFVERV